jgi:hypothetical protein
VSGTDRRTRRLKTTIKRRPPGEQVSVTVPAIVSRELWEVANERLSWAQQHLRRQALFPYLLSGMVRHPQCGGWALAGQQKTRNFRTYQCGICHQSKAVRLLDNAAWLTVAGALLDAIAVPGKFFAARAGRPQPSADDRVKRLTRLDAEIAALQERVGKVELRWARGEVSDETRDLQLATIQAEINKRRGAIEELRRLYDEAGDQAGRDLLYENVLLYELTGWFSPPVPAPLAVRELLEITVERIELDGNRAVIETTPILGRRRLEIADITACADDRLDPYPDPLDWLREVNLPADRAGYQTHLASRDRTLLLQVRELLAPWRLTEEDKEQSLSRLLGSAQPAVGPEEWNIPE